MPTTGTPEKRPYWGYSGKVGEASTEYARLHRHAGSSGRTSWSGNRCFLSREGVLTSATKLVESALEAMISKGADEVPIMCVSR